MTRQTTFPLASVIIPSWNGRRLLAGCLPALAQQTYRPLEVIVTDGASVDGTRDFVAERFPAVRYLGLNRNRGFAGNVNAGIRAARGEIVLLLNNDARAAPEWVECCVAALCSNATYGAVATRVLFEDGKTINSAGDGLTRTGWPFQRGSGCLDGPAYMVPGPVFSAMGGAAGFRRALLEDVGLLDEEFFAYLEDVDLGFRAQLRGWSAWYAPDAVVFHAGSATGGGTRASFYNGRNLIRLLVKNVPAGLVTAMLPGALANQARRAGEALGAWRGAAARATLRGQLAGLRGLPSHLAARRGIQARKRVADNHILALLSAGQD